MSTKFSPVAGKVPTEWLLAILIGQGEAVKYVAEHGEEAVAGGVPPDSPNWPMNTASKALFFASYLLHKAGILTISDQRRFAEEFCDPQTAVYVEGTLRTLFGIMERIETQARNEGKLVADEFPEAQETVQ